MPAAAPPRQHAARIKLRRYRPQTRRTAGPDVRVDRNKVPRYGFLTTAPNAVVGAIHPQAMPVILTTEDEVDRWLQAPTPEALRLQRPLPDDALRIVARGEKEDPAASSATP